MKKDKDEVEKDDNDIQEELDAANLMRWLGYNGLAGIFMDNIKRKLEQSVKKAQEKRRNKKHHA